LKFMPSKKLQQKLVEDAGLGVLAACLMVMVAAPFYVYAIGDGTASDALGVSGLGQSLRSIKDDVEILRGRMDMINNKIDALSSRLEMVYMAEADPVASSPGVAECLDACRKTASACFVPPKTTTSTAAASPMMPMGTGAADSAACLARVESCARSCRPVANNLSCDTTCAIQLGACVKGAGSDRLVAAACRTSNEGCLRTVCARGLTGTGRASQPPTALPSDMCRSQCLRDFTVCRQVNRLSSSALFECAEAKKACEEFACSPLPAAAPKVPPAAAQNIVCENDCTRSFLDCRDKAGDNGQALEFCNSGYGSCRNQCLISSGGGFAPEPAPEAATPTSRGE